MQHLKALILLLVLAPLLASCGGGGGGGGGGGTNTEPQEEQEDTGEEEVVTFSELRQRIILPKCLRCHSTFNEEAGVRARVVPGNPDGSVLFRMVESGRMPLEGEPLTTEELEVVRNYINGLALREMRGHH